MLLYTDNLFCTTLMMVRADVADDGNLYPAADEDARYVEADVDMGSIQVYHAHPDLVGHIVLAMKDGAELIIRDDIARLRQSYRRREVLLFRFQS